jgi:EAL domain-containing protein (putative c-di-GMP-specific phosphodiesterase class I)
LFISYLISLLQGIQNLKMAKFKNFAIPIAVGTVVALVSNAVALEILLEIVNSNRPPSENIQDYTGRVAVSVLLTLWVSVMVALYMGRDKEKQASERNTLRKRILYLNKETGLPNAPWLDTVLEMKQNPLNETPLLINGLQIHVVLWWQKIIDYLSEQEKASLISYIKSEIFGHSLSHEQLGYLGNGVFYTYSSNHGKLPNSPEYVEFIWGPYTLALSQTEVNISAGYNSYKLVSLARNLATNVEQGADYFENLGALAEAKSARMPNAWDAVINGRIDFAFQPIFNLHSGAVQGFEMLARLKTESGDVLQINDEVAELLENSPLNLRFHELLLERLLAFQQKLNAISNDKVISINVPAAILIRPAMLKSIYLTVEKGLKLDQVAFELTERTLPSNSRAIKEGLYRLIGLGAKIHLDDFGAGQSSIETISTYNFSLVKLDRQFILKDTWTKTKASSLVTYLRSLGTEVLIEGIEDEDLATVFANSGAKFVQGFVFARPMAEANALEYAKIKVPD